ncbi:unnamed protein product [Hyaloperonospora brassicae]|uniref:Uncharacterized protein n=1 Tax=Hyaloperonospora brassicae TaxID=162125 RepID=A0AAV0SUH0_HYABA|nr:unnamed protein product [Hyaloperonospora brassicae]
MEQAVLQHRRQVPLERRRVERRSDRTLQCASEPLQQVTLHATRVEDLAAVTLRLGFLRQQLAGQTWTALRRWYLELNGMMREDDRTHMQQPVDDPSGASIGLLQSCEAVLAREQRCYDVVYRAGARRLDDRESLLDVSAPAADIRELLSFSTRSADGRVCRVTCWHDGRRVLCSASEYVKGLQAELDRLLSNAVPVDAVISFIWNTLKTEQIADDC